ncbi:hypothetical protein ASF72_10750 [Arthrobacter sp. Leaf141]|uniref:hypothetical protein n=1 Tax=Arthrobacter sp. Leaf141 TaxID=1736273 RepID=UPI0006FFE3CB|nr:hypothetical protein [Arthrobacter sp. Leaf141]KQR02504.1 hypothetical protein ASF72_10750 [Arthrobacter sp. Leaf141]
MSDLHGLTRNSENEPVCICGYRPDILNEFLSVGKQWKAKQMVLDHAEALNLRPVNARCPEAPFSPGESARYPRAGVRQHLDGHWLITLWDEKGIVHAWESSGLDKHETRFEAFTFAWAFIQAHRCSGVRLNGMEAA